MKSQYRGHGSVYFTCHGYYNVGLLVSGFFNSVILCTMQQNGELGVVELAKLRGNTKVDRSRDGKYYRQINIVIILICKKPRAEHRPP